MIYGKVNTWPSVRIAFSDQYSTIINNKLSAIKYMLSSIRYTPETAPQRIDMSSQTLFGHCPPIPMYTIAKKRFQLLLENLVPIIFPHQLLNCTPAPTVPLVETFLEKEWVPHRIEGNCISLIAIGSRDTDVLDADTRLPLCRQSLRCMIGTTPVLLTDEVIWVSPVT
jgi:hypothetical protein